MKYTFLLCSITYYSYQYCDLYYCNIVIIDDIIAIVIISTMNIIVICNTFIFCY